MTIMRSEIRTVQRSAGDRNDSKIEYEEKVGGRFVTLSGFFVDKILDGGAYYAAYNLREGAAVGQEIRDICLQP